MSKEMMFSVSIKDCEVQSFRAGGKGGQNQNKVSSGVRVVHRPSGAVGEARDSRDWPQNRKAAFRRMAESVRFQQWAQRQAREIIDGRTLEESVDAMLSPENLNVEVRDKRGRWVAAEADA